MHADNWKGAVPVIRTNTEVKKNARKQVQVDNTVRPERKRII